MELDSRRAFKQPCASATPAARLPLARTRAQEEPLARLRRALPPASFARDPKQPPVGGGDPEAAPEVTALQRRLAAAVAADPRLHELAGDAFRRAAVTEGC
jgi:hypothetical protein